MTKEEKKKYRQEAFEKRKSEYYSLSATINNMQRKLKNIEKNRGHTIAFKQLMLALDGYEQQIREDFSRYDKNIKRSSHMLEVKSLQQSLNRERKLREELEHKVKEATTSSGLFIKFVREKLGV